MATAEAAEKAVGGGEAAKAGGGSKKLILILVPLLLVAAVGGAWFAGLLPFGGSGGAKGEHASAGQEAEAGHEGAASAGEGGHGEGASAGAHGGAAGTMRPLDPFLANLADDGANRYLKATIQVEFASEPPAAFDARMPQIRDVILTLLTSRTFAEIRTPSGKEDLRDDVIDRLNHVLQVPAVKAVYFTEFIVQ